MFKKIFPGMDPYGIEKILFAVFVIFRNDTLSQQMLEGLVYCLIGDGLALLNDVVDLPCRERPLFCKEKYDEVLYRFLFDLCYAELRKGCGENHAQAMVKI